MSGIRRELVVETKHDIEKFKEGSKIFAKWLGKKIKEDQKRDKELMNKLISLLKKKTIDAIVQNEKVVYEVFKLKEIPLDDSLLHGYFERLINDFDQNTYKMTGDDIPIIAKSLNENPLKSYFILGD